MSQNELAVSPEEMAAAAQAEVTESAPVVETEQPISGIEADPEFEVTSDFWNEGEAPESTSDSDPEAESDTSQVLADQETIKYKANGEEQEITLEEAKKRLSLLEGSRKAFSDRAKLRKQYKEVKAQVDELQSYKDTFDKLERIKNNPAQLFEAITGESYAEFLNRELEKRHAYQSATPEQQRAMEAEERLRLIEQQMQLEKQDREKREQEAETKLFKAEKSQLQGRLEREFFKHELPNDNPQVANKLRKMLWRNALADLKDYHNNGYKLTDKVIQKAFADNSSALQYYYGQQVEKGVSTAINKKKESAKEKAQIASTRNYQAPIDSSISKLDPMSLFNRFKGAK